MRGRSWQVFSKLCDVDLGWWSAAWDQYLLAAVMLHQLTFEQALRHKKVRELLLCGWPIGASVCTQVILDVAADAGAGETPRRPQLAIHHDETVRRTWEEKRGKLGGEFDLGKEVSRSCVCSCVYKFLVCIRLDV